MTNNNGWLPSLATFVLCVIPTLSVAQEIGDQEMGDRLFREAYAAANADLRSGIGEGRYQQYANEKAGETKLTLQEEWKAKIYFNGKKYKIVLQYLENGSPVESVSKRIILFDGKTLAMNEEGTTGSHPRILSNGGDFEPPDDAEFVFNPCRLWDSVLRPSNFDGSKLRFRKKPGGYVGDCYEEPVHYEFDVPSDAGYHVTAIRLTNDGEKSPAGERKATWRKQDGVWYVGRIEHRLRDYTGHEAIEVLEFDTFQVNPQLSDDLFTFSALNIPSGARILDGRPNPTGRLQAYVNGPLDQTSDASVEAAIAQLIAEKSSETSRSITRRMILLISAGVLMVLGGLLVLLRRRRKFLGN